MEKTVTEKTLEFMMGTCRKYNTCNRCPFFGKDGCQIEFTDGCCLGDLIDLMDAVDYD